MPVRDWLYEDARKELEPGESVYRYTLTAAWEGVVRAEDAEDAHERAMQDVRDVLRDFLGSATVEVTRYDDEG